MVCRSGHCRRCGIRPRRRRDRAPPRAPNNAILQVGILDHRESNCPAIAGTAAPGGERKFLLHSRFASRTAKSTGHRRAAVPGLHSPPGRVGTARTMPSPRRVRAVWSVGNASHDGRNLCNGLRPPGPGPTTTVQIATIGTPASNLRTDTAASTSRCADLWEKPSASRTLDTPLREEPRDSAQFRTTVGDPTRHDIDIAVGILVGLLGYSEREAFEGAGARGAPYRRWHRQGVARSPNAIAGGRHGDGPQAAPYQAEALGDLGRCAAQPAVVRTYVDVDRRARVLATDPGPPVLPRASRCISAKQIYPTNGSLGTLRRTGCINDPDSPPL